MRHGLPTRPRGRAAAVCSPLGSAKSRSRRPGGSTRPPDVSFDGRVREQVLRGRRRSNVHPPVRWPCSQHSRQRPLSLTHSGERRCLTSILPQRRLPGARRAGSTCCITFTVCEASRSPRASRSQKRSRRSPICSRRPQPSRAFATARTFVCDERDGQYVLATRARCRHALVRLAPCAGRPSRCSVSPAAACVTPAACRPRAGECSESLGRSGPAGRVGVGACGPRKRGAS